MGIPIFPEAPVDARLPLDQDSLGFLWNFPSGNAGIPELPLGGAPIPTFVPFSQKNKNQGKLQDWGLGPSSRIFGIWLRPEGGFPWISPLESPGREFWEMFGKIPAVFSWISVKPWEFWQLGILKILRK